MATDGSDSRGQPSNQYRGTEFDSDEIAGLLTELARSLHEDRDPDEVLQNVVYAAIELIPGVEEASISVVFDRKTVRSRSPSGSLPALVDQLQTRLGQGPCLEAAYEELIVRVPDMRTESRWPLFVARAREAGVGSMLAFQLFVEQQNLGALNLYSRHPNAFTDESEHIGQMVATHAALAYADANEVGHLTASISTRDKIGQAKGILMERYKITDQRAFMLLAGLSQNTNTELTTIAESLTSTGELPGTGTN